jgi:hypothetical protein
MFLVLRINNSSLESGTIYLVNNQLKDKRRGSIVEKQEEIF